MYVEIIKLNAVMYPSQGWDRDCFVGIMIAILGFE